MIKILKNILTTVFLSNRFFLISVLAYEKNRKNGCNRLCSAMTIIQKMLFIVIFTPNEETLSHVINNKKYFFPHINENAFPLSNIIRVLLQIIWMASIQQVKLKPVNVFKHRHLKTLLAYSLKLRVCIFFAKKLKKRYLNKIIVDEKKDSAFILVITIISATSLAILCITQPFTDYTQLIFMSVIICIAMAIFNLPGRLVSLILISLSLTVSSRYIWWRYTNTLVWQDNFSTLCGILLLAAETYSFTVLILGFLQIIWPLNREPAELPENEKEWPCVDIMIPTYNEDISVVKNTLYAALGIDWPKNKLRIWLLDDGNREQFKDFAKETGIQYIARKEHTYAKAGNINNALRYATGEFVSIFDCDHIPAKNFLKATIGWFIKEKKLAVLQTPHHFFSPDPFERNLNNFKKIPNEGMLFYGLLQDGNDLWNATFFCGSCAVIRRKPLDEIGGIAVETVTEDAHTSLRLHRKGYTSAYIRFPLSAGLATESLSSHIGQRIRWARGMIQIFRTDNPLTGRGLTLPQRLCYANAMLHFLSGLPRLIYMVAPLAFLVFHAYIISAPAISIILFVIPHMFMSSLTNSRIQGKYRSSFWSEIYETVLAWYITPPTVIALINPKKGKFNVTTKGGVVKKEYVDWVIARPYFLLFIANLTGVIFAVWRILYGPSDEYITVAIGVLWTLYNLVIVGCAMAVSVESRQLRELHRVDINLPAMIATDGGNVASITIKDYSGSGIGARLNEAISFRKNEVVALIIENDGVEFYFPAKIVRVNKDETGLSLLPMSTQQNINFMQCTFAKSGTWQDWHQSFKQDKPLHSMINIIYIAFKGYMNIANHSPERVKKIFLPLNFVLLWLVSFLPRKVKIH